jgi:glutamate/tyrosine decarboxylase-like PLP-dependent enzyme
MNGKDDLALLIKDYFQDKLVCALLFETHAGNEPHGSDVYHVGIITSQPNNPVRKHGFQELLEKHSSDEVYSADIVYEEDLRMSLNGYGFVKRDGKILTEPVTQSQKSIFNSYRKMLASFATPSHFLAGSEQRYLSFVDCAQNTVTSVTLTNYQNHAFSFDDFSRRLIANGRGYLGFSGLPTEKAYIKRSYWPILTSLVAKGVLQETHGTLKVLHPGELALPYVKDYNQYLLEGQYLGVHESEASWNEYMSQISTAGLSAYQTERPLVYQTPAELKAHVDAALPKVGLDSIEALVFEMDSLVNTYSINQSTVNFMAFPESGNSKAAVAASMLIPLWNQNLISVDKSAPVGTFIEVQVIEWLRQLVGYRCEATVSAENIGGVAATGGVMSNTVGLLVARSLAFPESRRSGLTQSKKKPYLLVADKTLEHYSHKAAFWWLGLGDDNVIAVKAKGYNFDISDLKQKIKKYNSGENKVVAVVCMAGDSRTMTIQNIDQVYAETSKHNIWLHVDACQGGIGLFSSNKDELCRNYNLADSISIDPHKGLGIPYSSSFCLFKDQNVMQHISKSTDITIAKGSYDIGQITPFLGSRPFDTLKLWALLKFHGLDGLAKNVDYRIDLTKKWAAYLNQSAYFIALNDPALTAISFSVDPRKISEKDIDSASLSKINKELHDRCYKEGWLVLHCFDLIDFENRLGFPDTVPLRVLGTNFGNVLLDESHFPKITAYMESQLEDVLGHM